MFISLFVLAPFSTWCDQEWYNGENILKPMTRFDARCASQSGVDAVEGKLVLATLRSDKVIDLPCKWQASLRVDVPYGWFYCKNAKPTCAPDDHLGDVLLQALLITPPNHNWTWGAGLQVVFPTDGGNYYIGDAKYEVHPTLGVAYDLGEWSEGAYAGLMVRQAWSVGGYAFALPIRQTYLEPFLNINLPYQWFVNFSPEIRYNWVTHAWFVPFDVMIGKMLTKKILMSLEYDLAVIKNYPEYGQQIELRIGYFF
ncbi:MAG: hypothetical protein Q8K75_10910 [Chlamydiales bacterium]|nr:hypothetical protein [Chlamydiales bacterium]